MMKALQVAAGGKAESASKAATRRMKVIKKCVGEPTIEKGERFCLEILSPEAGGKKFPLYRFFDKFAVVGRIIDSIGKLGGLEMDDGPRVGQ